MHNLAVFAGGVFGAMLDPILNILPIVAGVLLGRGNKLAALVAAVMAAVVIVGLTAMQDLPEPVLGWHLRRLVAGLAWATLAAGATIAWRRMR